MLLKLFPELLLKIVELMLLELLLNLELNTLKENKDSFMELMEILVKLLIWKILMYGNLLQLKDKFSKVLLKLVQCFLELMM